MSLARKCSAAAILFGLALALLLLPQQSISSAGNLALVPQADDDHSVPAFHDRAPAGALPATMSPDTFGDPVVQNAYTVAAPIKKVLYQEPCYCHCDRSQGHGSLLDCFASKHGSMCNVCMGEAIYSYEQTGKGKTAAQIRDGIEHGEWQKVDATKYKTYPAAN